MKQTAKNGRTVSENCNTVVTLPCGLRIAFKPASSSVAYCALSIQSGTSDEPAGRHGIAHMTEHMIFKGCEKRSATAINNRLERVGGELNAYTTKEETVVYSTSLREDLERAADLIFEIVFTSLFEEKELEKEKSVVADEINMCKDTPSDFIFEDFEAALYKGHPLARNILGTNASLKPITSDDIKDYVRKMFVPEAMSFVVVADTTLESVTSMVQRIISKYLPDSASGTGRTSSRQIKPECAPFKIDKARKYHQANCIIGSEGYSLYDPRRIALVLLCNILGGPASNSRLNDLLREKKALVYNIEANYTQYATTGVATIYFGCDKDNVDKCVSLVLGELERVCREPMSPRALAAAKKQLLAQLAISSENGEAQALSIGKSVLSYGSYLSDEQVRARVEAVTAEQLLDAARDVFGSEKISMLIYR